MIEHFVKFKPLSLNYEILSVTIADTEALLNFLYQEIGCSSIETVFFSKQSGDLMIVDEEGLFKEPLQVNLAGTAVYPAGIVGTVIFGREGQRDGEPDLVGYPTILEANAAGFAAKTLAEMKYGDYLRNL